MGKRKAAKRQTTKVKTKLDKEFSCLFCNHEKSIVTKLDRELKVGHLECKKCGVEYQTVINYLSEAIDIYSDWVDACEAANTAGSASTNVDRGRRADPDDEDEDEDED
ncbi:transcription elongation factor Elf1 like-domain-containing protein [Chytridium lagenaria]|nr:transcription elongation factor Elf1 like-domain-containing protein [Chytridium lagenaria]